MEEQSGGFLKSLEEFSANVSPIDFYLIAQNYDLFLEGIGNTVMLVVLSLVIGGLLSIPLAIARAYPKPVLNQIIWGYVYVFRGTPLLVQTFLIYYGLGQFEGIRESFLWPFLKEAWWCALLAFVLNTAAPDHPAQRLPARAAHVFQRSDLHAARHRGGEPGDDHRHSGCRQGAERQVLSGLRGRTIWLTRASSRRRFFT
jgi:arginine/ornithine transport system permease protein